MDTEEEIVMDEKEILRAAVREKGTTQTEVAGRMGMRQNALSAKMTRERMSLDTFREVLNLLGYDVAVIDRENGEVRWVVDPGKRK